MKAYNWKEEHKDAPEYRTNIHMCWTITLDLSDVGCPISSGFGSEDIGESTDSDNYDIYTCQDSKSIEIDTDEELPHVRTTYSRRMKEYNKNRIYKKKHPSGWKISAKINEDYILFISDFKASHPHYGKLYGDYDKIIYAESDEAYNHFIENHPPDMHDNS